MKFEDNIFGDRFSVVLHAVKHARRVEDDIMRRHMFAKRFDLTLQDNDGYIVSVDVRFVAGPGEALLWGSAPVTVTVRREY